MVFANIDRVIFIEILEKHVEDKNWLIKQLPKIKTFLWSNLKLELHPNKVSIRTLEADIDFLGWVHFFNYKALRTNTKKRMLKRAKEHPTQETIASYVGLLKHGKTYKINQEMLKQYYLSKKKI